MDDDAHLSATDKVRIKAEEIYRKAVIDELEKARKPTSRLGRLTSFFQSSFGGFIASSILLPACIWLFTALQAHYSKAEADEKLRTRLDAEIGYRLGEASPNFCESGMETFVSRFNSPTPSAYADFAGINTIALLHELSALVPKDQRPPLLKVVAALGSRKRSDLENALKIRGWLLNTCEP